MGETAYWTNMNVKYQAWFLYPGDCDMFMQNFDVITLFNIFINNLLLIKKYRRISKHSGQKYNWNAFHTLPKVLAKVHFSA